MLNTMNLDASWAQWQQALFVHAEVGNVLGSVECTGDFRRHAPTAVKFN